MLLHKLHFITQPNAKYSNAELVTQVCSAGVRLVQLRIKDKPMSYILEEAKAVKEVCKKYGATLILNDYVAIAKELQLDGVHLGKTDLSPLKAREILGNKAIIGGTANNLSDVNELINAEVNYIGLGPYRFTKTKEKLSPTLGIEGYKTILANLPNKFKIPIFAIGGITHSDVQLLANIGIYGVAISGAITNTEDITSITQRIIKTLN